MRNILSFQDFVRVFDFPPTQEQEQVIRSTEPAILVLAGAGAGKTATMSQRIAWHIASGNVQPDEVLGLTFTRKAAGELAERTIKYVRKAQSQLQDVSGHKKDDVAADLVHGEFRQPTIATYNAFASEIAMSYAMLIGEDPRARLITEGERWQIVTDIVQNWTGTDDETKEQLSSVSGVVDSVLALAASIIDNKLTTDCVRRYLLDEEDAISTLENGGAFRRAPFKGTEAPKGFSELKKAIPSLKARISMMDVVDAYFDYKKENSLIEYADQVAWATRILTQVPQIAQDLRSQFKLILLDEYQDTSINQAEFIAAAFKGAESVCAVGDPNQAIYGWRGASANALADFCEKFSVESSNVLSLSIAFRNAKNILHVANATTRGFERKWDARTQKALDDASGLDRFWLDSPALPLPKRKLSLSELTPAPKAVGGSVIHVHRHLRMDSYQAMAHQISKVFNEAKQRDPNKIPSAAVLIRKHRYVDDIVTVLEKEGLNYEIVGGEQIVVMPEIRLLRAILNIVSSPNRNDSLMVLFNYFGVGARDLKAFSRYVGDLKKKDQGKERRLQLNLIEVLAGLSSVSDLQAYEVSELGSNRIMEIARLLETVRSERHLHLPDFIIKVIDELNLYTVIEARAQGTNRVRKALALFVDLAAGFITNNPKAGIKDFCDWITAVEEKERGGDAENDADVSLFELQESIEPESNVVQILTVHSAKGLEWDVVAVPELVMGEFSDVVEGKAKLWQTRKTMLPFPLRSDSEYLPQFSAQSACTDSRVQQEMALAEDPAYCQKGLVSCMFFDYKNRVVPQYESGEARRLAYVAFTRPRSFLILGSYDFKDQEDVKVEYAALDGKVEAEDEGECTLSQKWKKISNYVDEVYTFEESQGTRVFADEILDDESGGVEFHETERPFRSAQEFLVWAEPLIEDDATNGVAKTGNDEAVYRWPIDVDRSLDGKSKHSSNSKQTVDADSVLNLLDRSEEMVNLLIGEKRQAENQRSLESDYFTASGIVSLVNDPSQYFLNQLRPIPREPIRAAKTGTDVHARIANYFNAPRTLDIDSVSDPWEMPIDQEVVVDEAQVNSFMKRFEESRFVDLPQLAIEQPVEISLLGKPVRCVIDAVFDTSKVSAEKPILIVDWKTGRHPSDKDIESRQFQLELYRLAWSHGYGVPIESIEACFYYLGETDPSRRELRSSGLPAEDIESVIAQKLEEGKQLFATDL
ncbi:UvrD-helicase domain-containing protein [Arcanobacterium ihumii]|uniref:UvrD-helicase domain-containing protein n=1 Tax=Arcanobacterium ihumii TaxID=2138162 RepID=UPI001358A927|nr:UvrD-helicase domain-containing protein [Arcanobacterium ihumii]